MSSYDVVVLGGGIHGVGVAQAAIAGGYRTLLIEKSALAAGTSSRSSKLIHGGLRYLETGQLKLVLQNIRERERLLKLAPDLVKRLTFYLPVYDDSKRSPRQVQLGLWAYDQFARFSGAPSSIRLKPDQWPLDQGLSEAGLKAVFSYVDAQTDDARLTRAVMQSALELGAELICPARFVSADIANDGCTVHYHDGHGEHTIQSETVVNALGPWILESAQAFSPTLPQYPYELIAGTHIECPGTAHAQAFYLESPIDHRGVFVLPWGQRTLIGTTETVFAGTADQIQPTQIEIDYLQHVYQHYFPNRDCQVLASWAGLRVLPQSTHSPFARSRETVIESHPKDQPRVFSILGGKLTGYRLTAERVMRQMRATLSVRKPVADTATLSLTPND